MSFAIPIPSTIEAAMATVAKFCDIRRLTPVKDLKAIEVIAQDFVNRFLYVYNPEYIEKCYREQPDSLIGLAKKLEAALKG